jgi:uncharacterized protein involved in outer membrane biogenesis
MTTDGSRRARLLRVGRNSAMVLVVLFVLFGVVGFLVAPGIVRDVAEKQIAEQTGRRATIGSLKLNPYVLSATIGDLKLFEPDGTTVAVQVDEVFANVSSASLFRHALVLDALRVTRPKISIVRFEAQRFNFSDIVDRIVAQPKSDSAFRFSLNNIELDDGHIAFDDRVTSRKHVVEHIDLGLPFVSNLPYDTDVFVTPKFAAVVNGSAIDLTGKVQPFSQGREASIAFDVTDLDVPAYLDFAPTALRFKVASAKLTTRLAISFHAAAATADGKATPQSLAISGTATLADLRITDTAGHEVIAVKRIDVEADKVEPLLSAIALKQVAIVEPRIAATRRRNDGDIDSIDLVTLFAPTPGAGTSGANPPTTRGSKAVVTIAAVTIERGSVSLTDDTLATPVTTTFDTIDLKADRVALQGDAPTDFALAMHMPDEGTIETKGNAVIAHRTASGTFRMRHFRPGAFANYVANFVAARIGDGTVDLDAHYLIDASGPELLGRFDQIGARIADLRSQLPNEKTPFVAADAIALEGGSYDIPTHAFAADSLVLTAPVVAVTRDAKGRLNLLGAVIEKAPDTARAGTPKGVAIVVKPADTKPFTAQIKSFAIERGSFSFDDDAQGVPVRIRASPLNLKAENIGTAAGAVVPFTLDTGFEKRGKLTVNGKFTASPLSLDASLVASNVAVGWLAAYAGDRLNVVLDDADLNARGTLRVLPPTDRRADASPGVSYRGSLGIARLRATDRVTSEEFVRWKSLAMPQVDFQMPAKNAPMSVSLGAVALDDFYARVIVNANGRLNLQDVVATPGRQQSVTNPEAAGAPNPAPVTAPTPATTTSAPKPQIHVQGVKLTNGRIGITDNFIKPNYSANLTDLVGQISAIASDASEPTDLRLDGKIDGDGVLTVSGKVDPLAFTTYTDIAAEAKDIELTRLSPYAIKYAGYAIERGKLSMTVKYHIDHGRLDASNRLFLDQLTFGEKIESPTATRLPVQLAVALLKNSRGEIDINLPISGSLSDPEFSVGGVIARVIVNLLTRAVTSPFSLIATAAGGGRGGADELGYVQFKPGVSDMTPEGKAKVETLAKALADRPSLKLDIIGRFDPASDPDGIKRDHLLDRLKDLKAKDQSQGGERVGRDEVTIESAEYPTYLARVYDDTKLPDKPRNVVGLAKTVPVDEMEKLLLANMKLDDNDPRWLAEARADVVRHFIEDTGKVAPSRVFLVTPKLDANGIDDKGAPNRVDFALR